MTSERVWLTVSSADKQYSTNLTDNDNVEVKTDDNVIHVDFGAMAMASQTSIAQLAA